MLKPLFSAVVMWSIGCVIPTPIGTDSTGTHHTPVITGGDPDFTKGTILLAQNENRELTIYADDADGADTTSGPTLLWVAIYFKDGDVLRPYTTNGVLLQTARGAVEYKGSVKSAWCELLPKPANGPDAGTVDNRFIYVYVADTRFPPDWTPPAPPPANFAGHFDFKYWVVNCD